MKDPRAYFLAMVNITILISVVVGVAAIFLVERLVPAISEILEENAYSVEASMEMQVALGTQDSAKFWQSFAKAKSNITLEGEKAIIGDIESLGQSYWRGDKGLQPQLTARIADLSAHNLKEMHRRDSEARFLGLAGAWALGAMVVLSVSLQLLVRSRVYVRLLVPISELMAVLVDYGRGNLLRRFVCPEAAEEVRHGGHLLNRILDKNMHS